MAAAFRRCVVLQSSLQDSLGLATVPGAEAPDYFQMPLRGY